MTRTASSPSSPFSCAPCPPTAACSQRTTSPAFALCLTTLNSNVFTDLTPSQLSKLPIIDPNNSRCSRNTLAHSSPRSSSLIVKTPINKSECPPKYLLPLVNTKSAPNPSGSCSGGGPNVESTTSSAPHRRAFAARARMLTASPVGFAGVSKCSRSPSRNPLSPPSSHSNPSSCAPVSLACSHAFPKQPWYALPIATRLGFTAVSSAWYAAQPDAYVTHGPCRSVESVSSRAEAVGWERRE